MKKYIAFFDLDNTILDTSSGKLFVRYAYDKGLMSLREMLYGVALAFLHRTGMYDTEEVINKWAMKYSGTPESDLIDFSNRWFDEDVTGHVRRSALDAIDYHKKNGGITVLLSAASPYICNPVRDYLDMDDVICTILEVVDSIFTGKLVGRYCYKDEKLKRAVEYCSKMNLPIESAYYYADSFADIPVLEKVDNPVCITPDKKLRKAAKKRGWEIQDW